MTELKVFKKVPQYLCFSNTFVFAYFSNPQYLIPNVPSRISNSLAPTQATNTCFGHDRECDGGKPNWTSDDSA
jgi:hypothetical protein